MKTLRRKIRSPALEDPAASRDGEPNMPEESNDEREVLYPSDQQMRTPPSARCFDFNDDFSLSPPILPLSPVRLGPDDADEDDIASVNSRASTEDEPHSTRSETNSSLPLLEGEHGHHDAENLTEDVRRVQSQPAELTTPQLLPAEQTQRALPSVDVQPPSATDPARYIRHDEDEQFRSAAAESMRTARDEEQRRQKREKQGRHDNAQYDKIQRQTTQSARGSNQKSALQRSPSPENVTPFLPPHPVPPPTPPQQYGSQQYGSASDDLATHT
ncbi:hypothetical protein B0A50_08214 [Salinomyces thailandicus]|uniref:Uncharacterized protein n=1 Tax=Salinomyces thailandicus TaxID=706561 RepID=A0A4U0TK53_9PEZI|nr:hypothetical protein B0A50_08214 [Salinomyces thailandica]